MLDLDVRSEARALLYHITKGTDPEPAAASWAAATIAEVRAVVAEALTMRPAERGSEWIEDFTYAHRWLRKRGYRDAAVAYAAVRGKDEHGRSLVEQSKTWGA